MSSTQLILGAPADGVIVPLNEVPDPVFAEGTLGDGLALDPLDNALSAPCDGEIVQCARTAHAVTLKTPEGIEVLIHLGLDTVELDGVGIELCVAVGQKVAAGETLIRFDTDRLAQGAMSLITPLIVSEAAGWRIVERAIERSGERLRRGEPMLVLMAEADVDGTAAESAAGPALEREVTLALAAGLHARPAARLRAIARAHDVELGVAYDAQRADARSLSELMNLGLVKGERMTLIARGERSQAALDAAEVLLTTPEADEHGNRDARPAASAEAGQLAGLVASQGLAIGPLVRYAPPLPRVPFEGQGRERETPRLRDALARVNEHIQAAMTRAEREGQSAEADILAAHLAWLDDPALFQAALARIDAGRSAGQAWREALDDEAQRLKAIGSTLMTARIIDLHDLQHQVMAQFSDAPVSVEVPAGAILIADDLTPSELIAVAAAKPAGLCLAAGGTTSHVAILARARGLPCLVAMGEALSDVDGDEAILDAERGLLEPQPDAPRLSAMRARIDERQRASAAEREASRAPVATRDGKRVEVCANVASALEAQLAADEGADGVGLLRSEFLFLERDSAPDEATQRGEYQAAVDALGGKPVIVRTLDIGADKQLPYLPLPVVANPALGVRGVRLWQSHPELLDTQLRALLAVTPADALRIMLPMVGDAGELRAVRRRLEALGHEMGLTRLPQLGAMIEVPSAALCAASLASEADFLSIGTNDLTQYALAMDREDPSLAARMDVLHPGVLRLIQATVEGAAGRCPVGVCGAAAGDPLALAVLVALGVDELSVEPARVPAVKAAIRLLDRAALADELPAWLALDDGNALRERLTAWLDERLAA
ncbi:Phosphocarrier protein HPr/phosphoenolpyruvate--protein phosphotransferase [Modicisalibacter muralis]|uniref:phosphoenolpyruvate--protein phosphotransferase n=1 Tax=Modicisalibacter muralis TaxID=119000 RepID=A0A1G9EXA1_9GAMM|nr:phosphoenolpyruvate--protein phosphotransferase [Halomonas muralis]SDK80816.1 Phosphocarrier protein HPr/phosphoenolpyruvate--protein phosphotransferase [Halomonas muralis]